MAWVLRRTIAGRRSMYSQIHVPAPPGLRVLSTRGAS
jgi:hypothetical protein